MTGNDATKADVIDVFSRLELALTDRYQRHCNESVVTDDGGLLLTLSNNIVRAAAENLLDQVFDLSRVIALWDLIPEVQGAVDAYRARRSRAPAMMPSRRGAARQSKAIQKRMRTAARAIDELLKDINENDDPGLTYYRELEQQGQRILASVWRRLSETYSQQLPGELIALLSSELPGIDAMLGSPLDLYRAAWICRILAGEIQCRCDITVSEAAKLIGVNKGVISRAAKSKKHSIQSFGTGKSLRLNRDDILNLKAERAEAKRKKQAGSTSPYFCKACQAFHRKLEEKCSNCERTDTIRRRPDLRSDEL